MEDEWTSVISGDWLVKFTYVDLPGGGAFLTAQMAGHAVVYSVILRQAEHPFNREGVERHFDYECPPISNQPLPEKPQSGLGSIWTWRALDADTKLIASSLVGSRDAMSAYEFMQDVASRLRGRVQLTTDGHRPYLEAVEAAFEMDIDFAVLVKLYGAEAGSETRYSPTVCIGCKTQTVTGDPDPKHISTSYVERQNLTMRMSMRRFTLLTNDFSKKIENHAAAVALHHMHHNFARAHKTHRLAINYFAYSFIKIHTSLRMSPAMAAGVTTRLLKCRI